jgi:hypothetical protein
VMFFVAQNSNGLELWRSDGGDVPPAVEIQRRLC